MWSEEADREYRKKLNEGCVDEYPYGFESRAGIDFSGLSFSNQAEAKKWWDKCKDKNGFRILSKQDKRNLDLIVTEKIKSL